MGESRVTVFDLGGVNSYLLQGREGMVLVDTGGHMVTDKQFDSRLDRLLQQLEQAGCGAGELNLLLLTHGDNDHVANALEISRRFGVPIAMHPADRDLVVGLTLEKAMESFRYRKLGYRLLFQAMGPVIRKATERMVEAFAPFDVDIPLSDSMDLSPYGVCAKVVHLPGHTPGSVGVLLEDGSLLAGDTLSNMGRPGPAPNAADFRQLEQSLEKLKKMDLRKVYPGHGAPFSYSDLGGN